VAGTISSSLGGRLAGVKVTANPTSGEAPSAVTSDADGKFSVSGVLVSDGKGTISLAELPDNCTDPGDVAYTGLAKGGTVTKDIEVTCEPLIGTITGVVKSSLGGTLQDVRVSVDPEGDAPAIEVATDADGRYTVASVPAGSGSVTVTGGFPSSCSAPAAATYENLAADSTIAVDFELSCEPTTGALTVTVVGLVDVGGAVHVSGPNSFDTTLTATSTLTDLNPGSYTITADTLVVDDAVVVSRYLAVIENSPATVVAGHTATATVTYAIRTGSGGLWFTNVGNQTIYRFAAGQLHKSGSPTDTTSIIGPTAPAAAAFDSAGNLWVSSVATNKVVAYTRDQLVGGGTPTPLRTISGGSLNGPVGLAFDDAGNLWVSNVYANSIVGYTAAQVKAGGTPTPSVTITSADLDSPDNVALDAAGNLWVVNGGGNSVVEFSSSQLATGGNIAAAVKITTPGSLNFPSGIAFDEAGSLWVANRTSATFTHLLVSFSSAQLAAGGTPTPSVTIDHAGDVVPGMLAFDESGGVWLAVRNLNALYRYASGQLASSGAPAPNTTITAATGGTLAAPSALVFDPHAEGLPIRW
jgi:sugar lactone lactonase YvrE